MPVSASRARPIRRSRSSGGSQVFDHLCVEAFGSVNIRSHRLPTSQETDLPEIFDSRKIRLSFSGDFFVDRPESIPRVGALGLFGPKKINECLRCRSYAVLVYVLVDKRNRVLYQDC